MHERFNIMSLVVLLLSAVILAATAIQSSALSIGRLTQQKGSGFVLHQSFNNHDCQRISQDDYNILVHRRRVVSSLLSNALFGTVLPIWTITETSIPLSSSYANAAIREAKTGILLPSVGEIESAIPTAWDEDDDNILSSSDKSSFSRLDSSPDTLFYSEPRFVEHVDEQAVETMTSYISDRLLQPGDAVLDLCSSWTSHIRQQSKEGKSSLSLKRVAGLGMNAKELESNPVLTDWTLLDLNADANVKLPYEDERFDVVLLQLSIDYLIHPLEVLKEASRVLRKNGRIAILFSNRLFLTKAVGLWTGSDDIEHAYTVGNYLHYCGGDFTNIKAEDLSTRKQKGKERVIVGDPLYVVTATKG